MSYSPGSTYYASFPTVDGAGALADPDALPTAALRRNGVDTAEVVTVTDNGVGDFTASGVIPVGWANGDVLELIVTALVNTEPSKLVIDLGRLDAAVNSRASQASLDTLAGYVDTEVAAIKAKTDLIPPDGPASASDIPTAAENADALLDRTDGVETSWTLRQALRVVLSVLAGKLSGAATNLPVFRDVNDSKNRVSATTDAAGNRSAVTYDKT